MYSEKFKIEALKLMKRLWGDQFYNPKENKWEKECKEGYVRGFTQYILDPIYKVCLYDDLAQLFFRLSIIDTIWLIISFQYSLA